MQSSLAYLKEYKVNIEQFDESILYRKIIEFLVENYRVNRQFTMKQAIIEFSKQESQKDAKVDIDKLETIFKIAIGELYREQKLGGYGVNSQNETVYVMIQGVSKSKVAEKKDETIAEGTIDKIRNSYAYSKIKEFFQNKRKNNQEINIEDPFLYASFVESYPDIELFPSGYKKCFRVALEDMYFEEQYAITNYDAEVER